MAVLVTGLGSALLVVEVVVVVAAALVVVVDVAEEVQEAVDVVDSTLQEGSNSFLHLFQTFVIVVESLATLLRIVIYKKMLVIIVEEVDISRRIARSPGKSESSVAITVANQVILLATATMLMSRNVTLVESLVTSRKTAPK